MKLELSDRWRAYFASMFDHAGCITIKRQEREDRGLNYQGVIAFNHLTMEQAAEIGKLLGLGVLLDYGKKCRWYLRVDEIPVFLDIVEPYSITRQEQIRIMREFYSARGVRHESPTEEMLNKREECFLRMQELTSEKGNGRRSKSSGGGVAAA